MAKIGKIISDGASLQRLKDLRYKQIMSAALGDFKSYKIATKEYASEAVKNFELLKEMQGPKLSAPLFSKTGLRLAKIWFLNIFRKKTPAEKLLKQMAEEEKIRSRMIMLSTHRH